MEKRERILKEQRMEEGNMILEEDRLELEGMKEHREIEKARLELVDKLMKHDIYDINHY
jgi:hypothetical protein